MAKAKKKVTKKKAVKKKPVTRKQAVKALKKVKKVLAAKKKPREIMNFKISRKDRAGLSVLAKKHANGNLSAWLRHAGLRYVPKRGEKIELPYNYRPGKSARA